MFVSTQKSVHWQVVYTTLFAMQLLIDCVVVESISCFVVHVWAPYQYHSRIESAFKTMTDIGAYLCKSRRCKWMIYAMPSLDAPRYFFPSVKLSAHYPHLIESAIIHSYHTSMLENTATAWSSVLPPPAKTDVEVKLSSLMTAKVRGCVAAVLRVFVTTPASRA